MLDRFIVLLAAMSVIPAGCSGAPPPPPTAAGVQDGDEDGIPDDVDECVTEKEDRKPPFASDGCKADPSDTDGDGLGRSDKCPAERESMNGFEDGDGCPDELPAETKDVVTVTKDELKCCAKVLFATGQATIDEASKPLLEHVAKTLVDHPEVDFLEVSGHADRLGNPAHNVDLTRRRAEAVVAALAGLGVDKQRLRAEGYGSYCPLDPTDTPEARELNRRVEFKIIRQKGAETGASVGCDAAYAKGIGPKPTPGAPAAKPDGPI